MDENEKLIIKGLITECVCKEMEGINTHLADIDKKLGNHFEHLTANYNSLDKSVVALNTNYEWIKKMLDNKCVNPDGSLKDVLKSDGKQDANIEWLGWGLKLLIGGIVLQAITLIFALSKLAQ